MATTQPTPATDKPKAKPGLRMRCANPDEPIHLALTTGHTLVIGPELVEVPKVFRSQAIARGALLEGQEPEEEVPESKKPATKSELILAGVKKMIEDGGPEDFTNDGKPKTDKLSALVGFAVHADERDTAYDKVAHEA